MRSVAASEATETAVKVVKDVHLEVIAEKAAKDALSAETVSASPTVKEERVANVALLEETVSVSLMATAAKVVSAVSELTVAKAAKESLSTEEKMASVVPLMETVKKEASAVLLATTAERAESANLSEVKEEKSVARSAVLVATESASHSAIVVREVSVAALEATEIATKAESTVHLMESAKSEDRLVIAERVAKDALLVVIASVSLMATVAKVANANPSTGKTSLAKKVASAAAGVLNTDQSKSRRHQTIT